MLHSDVTRPVRMRGFALTEGDREPCGRIAKRFQEKAGRGAAGRAQVDGKKEAERRVMRTNAHHRIFEFIENLI